MANLAQAFAGGFESGQAIGDTIVADRDLKQAQSESGPGADLFTTYQKAGQMAMQSGNTRVADKFLKQANEYKGDALKTKLAEMTVHHAEVSDFERTIRANDNPDSLKAAISSSDKLNPQEKLEYTGLVDKAQKSGKWDEFHKVIGESTETYKEQQTTKIAILTEQLAEQRALFDMNYKAQMLHIAAGKAAGKGIGKLSPEDKELQTELHEDVRGIRADAKSEIDATNKNYGLNDAQKAAKVVGIKKRRDDAIKAARDGFKHRDDEESPEPAKAKPISVSPEEVKSMSQKNIQQLIDGSVSEKEFENHYGKPPGWAKKVVDVYRNKDTKAGGAGADSKKELTDEEQLAEDLSKATGVQERNAIRNDYNIRQDRKAKQAKQKTIAAKGKEKTEAAIAKAQKQGLVLSGMSGTQLKFVDPKTGKEVLESEL